MAPIVPGNVTTLVAAKAALEKSLAAVEGLLKNSTAVVVENSTALPGNLTSTSAAAAAAPTMILATQRTLEGHLVAILAAVCSVGSAFLAVIPLWQLWLVLLASTSAFTATAIVFWPRNFRFIAAGAAVVAAAVESLLSGSAEFRLSTMLLGACAALAVAACFGPAQKELYYQLDGLDSHDRGDVIISQEHPVRFALKVGYSFGLVVMLGGCLWRSVGWGLFACSILCPYLMCVWEWPA
ncbi:hypothetical protein MAPG_06078 [Magnaporthiopsis poae ATCC 64411]|uniref:Transmembrane protein n=1 Tax=Magnaporthiopsis poae (strain ATCC 64411 / 73-15) TaxID=644358 RepID=A0A0C4E134_MAGP6|nr:hypothetical protein MAPG_06078 [Magnaporthiopsis poae ATCC 64411]